MIQPTFPRQKMINAQMAQVYPQVSQMSMQNQQMTAPNNLVRAVSASQGYKIPNTLSGLRNYANQRMVGGAYAPPSQGSQPVGTPTGLGSPVQGSMPINTPKPITMGGIAPAGTVPMSTPMPVGGFQKTYMPGVMGQMSYNPMDNQNNNGGNEASPIPGLTNPTPVVPQSPSPTPNTPAPTPTPTPTPSGGTTATPAFTGGNSQAIADLYAKQIEAAKKAIEYQKTLVNYQPQRNQASFQSAQNKNAINEQMAQTGRFKSGYNITEQGRNASDLNQSLTDYNIQEKQDLAALDQQIALAEANGNIELAKALIEEKNRIEAKASEEEQRKFENDLALKNYELNRSEVTGVILDPADQKIIDSMTPDERAGYQQYADDYMKQINYLKANGGSAKDIAALTALRNLKVAQTDITQLKKWGVAATGKTAAQLAREVANMNDEERMQWERETYAHEKANWDKEDQMYAEQLTAAQTANAAAKVDLAIKNKQFEDYDYDKAQDRYAAGLELQKLQAEIDRINNTVDMTADQQRTLNELQVRSAQLEYDNAKATADANATQEQVNTRTNVENGIIEMITNKEFNPQVDESYKKLPLWDRFSTKKYGNETAGGNIMDYIDALEAAKEITGPQADLILMELKNKFPNIIK